MGLVRGEGMDIVARLGFETKEAFPVQDYILLNQGGLYWKLISLPELEHNLATEYVTAADFNNDGFVDIAGVRSGQEAQPNGEPFLLLNEGEAGFSLQYPFESADDDMYRSDIIAHGFFNADGLPDLFHTSGNGLRPFNRGPYQLWLNTTDTDNHYLVLELQGTTSNRDAIGAQVEVRNSEGELLGYRELGPGYGRGQDSHLLHFGLGAQVDGPVYVQVRWPGGGEKEIFHLPVDRLHVLEQGAG
jgi:hypothetical protein